MGPARRVGEQSLANEDALTFAVLWLRVCSGMGGRRFLDVADFEPEAPASGLDLRFPIAFNGIQAAKLKYSPGELRP